MRILRLLFTVSCFALLVSFVTPKANADEWDKKTIVTFSGPVTVSGKPLDAGTYVFKLAGTVDRHVVQIFNADESHIIYTILAIPDWRVEPTGKTVIKFSEKAGTYETADRDLPSAGIPVKEWFYPGDNFGQEFLVKPAVVAEKTTETTVQTAQAQPETTPEPPMEAQPAPAPEPVPETAQVQPPPEQPAPAPEQPTPAPAAQPTEMPQTASPVPLIGLIGLSSLGAALALREAVKRMS